MHRAKAFALILLFCAGCANQLPPSGGDDDLAPPRLISVSPARNTINFRGNTVTLKFDERLDRRSVYESIVISPVPRQYEVEYNNDEIEINFPQGLEPNRTYSITLTTELKDQRGNNKLEAPIQIAFSTGSKIDRGAIQGNIYGTGISRFVVLAYQNQSADPSVTAADFITTPDVNGIYKFNNLPAGTFRLYAVKDEDRNRLYTPGTDKIFLLQQDVTLTDTTSVQNVNFITSIPSLDVSSPDFFSSLSRDSGNYVHSSIQENEKDLPSNANFYFYFPDNELSRSEIADAITLSDSLTQTQQRIVYNWLSDSVLQIFPVTPLQYGTYYKFNFNLPIAGDYREFIRFRTIDESDAGVVSGKIERTTENQVHIFLVNKNKKFIQFSHRTSSDTTFSFRYVPPDTYLLFAFLDVNENGTFETGQLQPYMPSEPFILFEELNVQKGREITNLILQF